MSQDYTIVIHGTGLTKHSSVRGTLPTSDELLNKFVQELEDNGHVVEVATITHGGREKVEAE